MTRGRGQGGGQGGGQGRGQRGVVRGHGQWGVVRGCGQGAWPSMRYKRYDNVFLKINTIRISFVLLFQFGILQYNWKVESNN